MQPADAQGTNRRDFVKATSTAAAATALMGVAIPKVHAAEDNTINVALIGCGGRGTGAASNALSTTSSGPIKLIAMADVFASKLNASHENLKKKHDAQLDVPDDRKFIGFDGYQKAMDCLRPGDIAIFATPPGFRWVMFDYAIKKNLNVFMEKPTTVDGPGTRKMLALAEQSKAKNLKVGVGLMCRHCEARQELFKRIRAGEIGDLLTLRCYRMHGPVGSCETGPNKGDMSELLYQIKNFHSFLWASGGAYSDFMVHNIDECCWMKDAWPVSAIGNGGRHYRGDNIDQNFDHYSVEYTFDDGAKMFMEGRWIAGCRNEFASYAHGTKGMAVISASSHWPSKAAIYKGQIKDKDEVAWSFGKESYNPYQKEWDELVAAVRSDTPYNEAQRGAMASLVTSMGRMACHTGQEIKLDQILNSEHEFAPNIDKLTMTGDAPVKANEKGLYPIPMPGITTKQEYA
ncbi:MAG: Gfo/Idh/MocA family oxidoreductase [Planctomycetes bacterium]|nr:Gfo/Idh/MocA family oxidoreductase [Planctomycetota bacterium]